MNYMKYQIICILSEKQIILRENLTEKEVLEFKTNLKKIYEFMNEVDNYTMILGNAKDFLNYARRESIENMTEFTNLNRLFMNWLNSYYAWTEYHERYHKALFGKLKSEYFDKYSEYRITYYLRRYTTHQSCCITKTQFLLDAEQMLYEIPVDKMLEEGEPNRHVKSDLQKIASECGYIEARKLLERMMEILEDFQTRLWNDEWIPVKEVAKEIKKYIRPDGQFWGQTYIIAEDESVRPFNISNPLRYLMEKMNLYPQLKSLCNDI